MKQLRRRSTSAFNPHNKVAFVQGGAGFFDELEALIRGARRIIHFQTYIFAEDATGHRIRDALVAAAGRGVTVYLLCDGYATTFSQASKRAFASAGIRFRYFEPLFSGRRFYFGRRLHHKVVTADERYALVGGINIADKYHGVPPEPPWLDFAVRVEGQAALSLHMICESLWSRSMPGRILPNLERKAVFAPDENRNPVQVRVRRNDWVRGQIQIMRSYAEMLNRSRHGLIIVSSYFLPSRLFRQRLQNAARRGVRVRVVLAGVSDVRLSLHAARYLYGWMLGNGLEVYEYTRSVLHGKLATSDGLWMTVGSYNINSLSSTASVELNLDIREPDFVKAVDDRLEAIIRDDCRRITAEDYSRTRNLFNRLIEWGGYQLARFLMFLFTYNLKQEQEASGD